MKRVKDVTLKQTTMTLNNTPTTVLENEILVFKKFMQVLQSRDNVNPETTDEKITNLVKRCEEKIKEFEDAILKLKQ
jgi:hypothetical protein